MEAPLPSSWRTRLDYSRVEVTRSLVLPAPRAEAAKEPAAAAGRPYAIGFGRPIPPELAGDLARDAVWTVRPDGSRVTSLSVRSPGALSVRAALRARLPEGAVLRFFAPGDSTRAYPVLKWSDFERAWASRGTEEGGASGAGWSPVVAGDVIGLELELPPEADAHAVELRLALVSHLQHAPGAARSPFLGPASEADECPSIASACRSLPACPKGAIARVLYTTGDGKTFTCTATAVNSARSEDENREGPYLLTANHCVATQSAASTVETYWHYERESCDGDTIRADAVQLQGGADLESADPDTDTTLLSLRQPLPDGACLAGWDARPAWPAGTAVTMLHHPLAEPKAWAGGVVTDGAAFLDHVDGILVQFEEGRSHPGSSGSGLFAKLDPPVLIGVLFGSFGGCDPRFYGSFARFFRNHASRLLDQDEAPPPDDHGNNVRTATWAPPPAQVTGEIDGQADADVFEVEVTGKGILRARSTGSLDTVGRLKRTDGSLVASDDDSGEASNFRVESEVSAGTYFVKVTGYNPEAAGSYALDIEFTPAEALVRVPFLPSSAAGAERGRQGFVRVRNRSGRAGEVRIHATDDNGASRPSITLSVGPNATQGLNTTDLEQGNPDKGLSGGTGAGEGNWRLAFDADVDIAVGAYVRTEDGFLTGVGEAVRMDEATGLRQVPIFNPASNSVQRSLLRLVNLDAERTARVTIEGHDDDGRPGMSAVEVHIPPRAARTLDAVQLEGGAADLSGRLGDGRGKWRLSIDADTDLEVINLLDAATGSITNLSAPEAGLDSP